jgi:YbbR domain-containing protein
MRQAIAKVGWRMLALAASFALWLTFVASPELLRSVEVPIDYQNMPTDLDVSSELPRTVQLQIRAAGPRLNRLQPSDLYVVLNLGGVHQQGERTFTIQEAQVERPAGVQVVRAVPAQVRLRFERHVTAGVPVLVRFGASPPDGYRVVGTEVRPQRVLISGPESHVRALAAVDTDPIDLSGVIGQGQFQVPAFVRDSQLHFVSSPAVQVIVRVAKTSEGGPPSGGQTTVRH